MAGSIGRIELPTEFYDRTSAIVLRAPQPQFLYAKLVYAASAQAELRRLGPDAIVAPGRPSGMAVGAPYPDLSTMEDILADPIRSDAIVVSDELAQGRVGHTIRMNRPVFAGGGYTLAARGLASGANISLVPQGLTDQQVSITIQRNTGPYASGGSATQPFGISRADAQGSVHMLAGRIGAALQYDRNMLMDSVFATYFDSATTVLYPGDSSNLLTSDAAAWPVVPVGSSRPMDLDTVLRMEQALHDAKIPRFANGRYLCYLTPLQMRQLRTDPQYRGQSAYLPERNLLSATVDGTGTTVVNGSIELYTCQTNIVDSATVSGVKINHACMFGPGAVGYAPTVEGCRIAVANEDNYGEDAKAVWICYEGSNILNNAFMVSAHSD
jgi:hypothetical protein